MTTLLWVGALWTSADGVVTVKTTCALSGAAPSRIPKATAAARRSISPPWLTMGD
jgi:hypothetical protein